MPAPQTAALAAPAAPLLAPAAPLPAPAAPVHTASTGTDASRALLSPTTSPRPLTLWGSSSMSSQGGAEATPLEIRIHDHLSLAAAPAVVHAFGVGATRSAHTLLMRGLDTPTLRVTGPADATTGAVPVTLEPALNPAGPLQIPGTCGDVAGTLDGSTGTWSFRPDDPVAPVAGGVFSSSLAAIAQGSRQILWMGKNNITDTAGVLHDTQRMWDAAEDPAHDTLVLGQWPTGQDPTGSATGTALALVNTEQQRRYGDQFLDLASLLTTVEGLACPPLQGLRLGEQASARDALAAGVVPEELRAPDGIHLNGWGNLAVSWAIVDRLRELGWL